MGMLNVEYVIEGYLVGYSHYSKKDETGEEKEWFLYYVLVGQREDKETGLFFRPQVEKIFRPKEALGPENIKLMKRVRLIAYENKEADGTIKTKYRDIKVLN